MTHNQKEIKRKIPLLREDGSLVQPGFCKRNLYDYNKEYIASHPYRLKEWDFYQVSNGRYMVQFNFFNVSWFSALTAELCDLNTGQIWSDFVIEPLTAGKHTLSDSADDPFHFVYQKKGRYGRFYVKSHCRYLHFLGKWRGKKMKINLKGIYPPDDESLTVAIPFHKKNCFFYTQKKNCIPTKGYVEIGDIRVEFSDQDTFMVMDWGRGVWPWKSQWYWSNGSSIIEGKRFGFELTWGFGDTEQVTETALFYDGYCHKIGEVYLEEDPEKNKKWMHPWHFLSRDGRLDLTLSPRYDHESGFIFLNLLGMKSHQLHGNFNGYVILDDGRRLEIKNMYAFAEKVHNRW